jgi:hypothetical protein
MRGLLLGTAIGNSALLTIAWCALIALIGYRWAMNLYNRDLALIGPRLVRASERPMGPPSCTGTLGVRICNSGDSAGWPSG